MLNFSSQKILSILVLLGSTYFGNGQSSTSSIPRVVVNSSATTSSSSKTARYPWKTHITCTVFWCGEEPCEKNPTPNDKSSWDTKWKENFGGYDDPDPENRIANHMSGEFRPKGFIPKLNPFYIALPYNDVESGNRHKSEASRVIPWFSEFSPKPGKSVLKSRWVQIYYQKKSCYAQWEDCGPWLTDDWVYVFGNHPPKTKNNGSAGIDISPSIRDYLGVKSGEKLHWRFVDDHQVPQGPWKKYGKSSTRELHGMISSENPSLEAERRYMEKLRLQRDQQFLKKPLGKR